MAFGIAVRIVFGRTAVSGGQKQYNNNAYYNGDYDTDQHKPRRFVLFVFCRTNGSFVLRCIYVFGVSQKLIGRNVEDS